MLTTVKSLSISCTSYYYFYLLIEILKYRNYINLLYTNWISNKLFYSLGPPFCYYSNYSKHCFFDLFLVSLFKFVFISYSSYINHFKTNFTQISCFQEIINCPFISIILIYIKTIVIYENSSLSIYFYSIRFCAVKNMLHIRKNYYELS